MANLRADNLTGTGGRNAITGSVYFRGYIDGTDADWLQTADLDDFDMGAGDFTFECWVKPTVSSGGYAGIFGMYNYDNDGLLIQLDNQGRVRLVNPGAIDQTGSTVLWDHWHHYAVARSGSTIKAFVNGVQEISHTYSNGIDFANGGAAVIGITDRNDYPGDYDLRGYISNLRLIKGTALYTSAFTPSTEELTAIDGTVLLCCQDSDDPTQEATGKTLTGYGNLAAFSSGDNLVTNGTFDSATTGWTSDGTVAIDSNRLKITNDAASYRSASQDITVVVGKSYRVSADCIAGTSNNSNFHVGNTGTSNAYASAVTSPVVVRPTTTTMRVTLNVGSNTPGHTALYDNVEAREVEPPKAPKVLPSVGVDEGVTFDGDTKVNTQSYMYFPTGDTSQRGRGRAILAGSNPSSNVMSYLSIQSQGNSIDFGDLITAADGLRGGSSHTRGLWAHSAASSPYTNTIEYVTIATTANALDFGDMTGTSSSGATGGNDTRAVFWEGTVPSTGVNICYATIASTGNAADFGDMTIGVRHIDSMNSSTRCVIPGGWQASPDINTNVIQYVTIATTGNAQDFGDVALSNGIRASGAFSSPTRGVYGGGADSPSNSVLNTIEYVTIASTGNGTDFGDLTTARRVEGGGTSSHIRGIWTGGHTPTQINTIDYVEIATTGNASDFGDSTGFTCGALSDCHGGLS